MVVIDMHDIYGVREIDRLPLSDGDRAIVLASLRETLTTLDGVELSVRNDAGDRKAALDLFSVSMSEVQDTCPDLYALLMKRLDVVRMDQSRYLDTEKDDIVLFGLLKDLHLDVYYMLHICVLSYCSRIVASRG